MNREEHNVKHFYRQVESFTGPVGIVYYLSTHIPKWNNIEECHAAQLSHARALNEYDPMQLHGVKTEEELEDMISGSIEPMFKEDQESVLDINMYNVHAGSRITPDELEAQRIEGEKLPRFHSWLDHSSIIRRE